MQEGVTYICYLCMDGCCLSSARLLFRLSVNTCSWDTYFMFELEEKLKKIVLFRYYIINEEKLESCCFIYTISVIVCQINSISIRNESSIINTSRWTWDYNKKNEFISGVFPNYFLVFRKLIFALIGFCWEGISFDQN